MKPIQKYCVAAVMSVGLLSGSAQAGVFNNAHFVEPGKQAYGVEPELNLSGDTGLAANFKFTQGINDLLNASAFIGTGSGARRFRIGADAIFDIFPDTGKQPGIGAFARAVYYRFPVSGEMQLLASPYVHKSFVLSSKDEVEPFVALPVGVGFDNGTYRGVGNFVLGAMFKNMDKFRYSLELGINTGNSETYISGGVTYYP